MRKVINIFGKILAAAGCISVCLGAMGADLNPLSVIVPMLIGGLLVGLAGTALMELTGTRVFYR